MKNVQFLPPVYSGRSVLEIILGEILQAVNNFNSREVLIHLAGIKCIKICETHARFPVFRFCQI